MTTNSNHKLADLRSDVRHQLSMRAQFSVSGPQPPLVRLSAASGVKDGWLEADAVDFSLGGVGLISLVFLPRHAILRLRLITPGEESRILFEGDTLVRRVVMTDRRPAYHLGTSFHELDADARRQVTALNDALMEGM